MKKINSDLYGGLLILVIAGIFYSQFDEDWSHFAAFFPQKFFPLLLVFAALLLIKGFRNPSMKENFFQKYLNGTSIFMIAVFGAWVISLDYIGFFISSFAAMFAMFVRFLPKAERTPPALVKLAVIALAEVGGFYLLFGKLLHVALPVGLVFG